MIVKLMLNSIIIPQGILPRVYGAVEEVVQNYQEAMEQGAEFPPIKVWRKNNEYWIIDGVHRYLAHKRLGKEYIEAELILDIKDDIQYMIEAIKANLKHGLPLSNNDKRESARRLYPKLNPQDIAKLFNVSERTVYNWISDLKKQEEEQIKEKVIELEKQGYKKTEMAKELGIPRQTISRWLQEEKTKEEETEKDTWDNWNDWNDEEEELEKEEKKETKTKQEKKEEKPMSRAQTLAYYAEQIDFFASQIYMAYGYEELEKVLLDCLEAYKEIEKMRQK
jgi:transposase